MMAPHSPVYAITAVTDIGVARSHNEDAVLALQLPAVRGRGTAAVFLAVADGMGGLHGGEVASGTAIAAANETVLSRWRTVPPASADDWIATLQTVVAECLRALRNTAVHSIDLAKMGTTLTCVAVSDHGCAFAHVGDSRAYLLRNGELRRLTTDHNAAQELASEGRIRGDEAATHHSRHVLTRWLAPDAADIAPDVGSLASEPGDILLVCSDGLYTVVPDDEIARLLGASPESPDGLDRVASSLVERANKRGGRDNISVVLARRA
jgi:protein phosphatase